MPVQLLMPQSRALVQGVLNIAQLLVHMPVKMEQHMLVILPLVGVVVVEAQHVHCCCIFDLEYAKAGQLSGASKGQSLTITASSAAASSM